MDWPVIADDDGEPAAAILIISKRPGGFLAAVPTGLARRGSGRRQRSQSTVGPSTVLLVPGVMYEQGQMVAADSLLPVVVVDLGTGALAQLRATGPSENYPFSYDADQPFAFPSPKELLAAAREWVAAGAGISTLQYFSAEGEDEAIADGTRSAQKAQAACSREGQRWPLWPHPLSS